MLWPLVLAAVAEAARGSLVLVGGGLLPDSEIYSTIIQFARGKGLAKIGIITAASSPKAWDRRAGTADASNAEENADYYAANFKKFGALSADWIPIDLMHRNQNDSATVALVKGMTGFFFGGGDQQRLISCLSERADLVNSSDVLSLIISMHLQQGVVIAGSSAGTMAQVGTDAKGVLPMITAGTSYAALTGGVHLYGKWTFLDTGFDAASYNPYGGTGAFAFGLLDTHFKERGRQGRLIGFTQQLAVSYGFGVDQNTALVVSWTDNTPEMTVVGESGVTVVDATEARQEQFACDSKGNPLFPLPYNVMNVKVHYFTSGDKFSPTGKVLSIPSWKLPIQITRDESPLDGVTGIFEPDVWVRLSVGLMESGANSTFAFAAPPPAPSTSTLLQVRLTKKTASAGYSGTSPSGARVASVVGLVADIFPALPFDRTADE